MAFENDPFSLDVRDGILEDAKRYGMKVVVDDKLPPDLNDMAATLTKVRALKPDVLLVSGHEKGATLVVRQTAEIEVDVPDRRPHPLRFGQDRREAWARPAEGVLCASQWDRSSRYKDKWFGTRRRVREDVREGVQLRGAVPGRRVHRLGARLRRRLRARRLARPDKVRDASPRPT